MSAWWSNLGYDEFFTSERVVGFARGVVTAVLGFILARIVSRGLARSASTRFGRQETMLLRRLTFAILFGLVLATALHQVGFQLSVLLGAAGILTVGIGFASQTSASNLISGLFLVTERAFVVGDTITVEGVTGEVLSIDLLSVKMRTFDNLYVRVPNEMMIKSRITNLTHFPLRRVDIKIGVAYKENLTHVREVLEKVADWNPLCLDEPKPLFIFKSYGESAIEVQFSVWGKRENYLALCNGIQEEIKEAFDKEGIEIPYRHISLSAASVTEPFPVRMVSGNPT